MEYRIIVLSLQEVSTLLVSRFGANELAIQIEACAEAVEALLAERKAMLEDLRSMLLGCDSCKHELLGGYEYPCCECERVGGEYDHWQGHGTSET